MKTLAAIVKFLSSSAAVVILLTAPALAQRDHLTDAESELLRYHQELDKRIEILIKAADRRFAIINGAPQPAPKKSDKDEPDWGDNPKGTRAQLLGDVAGILDEAIEKIDDVGQRDAKNSLASKSLRKLHEAAARYMTMLQAMKSKVNEPDEIAALDRIAENANQIIEAGNKMPTPAPEESPPKRKP